MIELIVWDFNGTVLDDAALCVQVENKLRAKRGLPDMTMTHYLATFRFPVIDYYNDNNFHFTVETFDEISREYMDIYQSASLQAPLRQGVVEAIETQKQKGRKQILLSASQKDNLMEQTNHFNITRLFDAVLGLDDIYGNSKTALAVNWFKQHNIPPETAVFIGDTTHDYEVAQAVGCGCILLCGGHNSRERLLATGAPVLAHVSEVAALL